MFYIGLDLGKRQDHSAIAIVRKPDARLAWMTGTQNTLMVRRVERLALGTSYPHVVERVREIVRAIGECTLVVDGTGGGAPVVDLLRSARLGCGVTAVTITGGEKASGSGLTWSVPKRVPDRGSATGAGERRVADCAAYGRCGRAGAGADRRADHGRAGNGEGTNRGGWQRAA